MGLLKRRIIEAMEPTDYELARRWIPVEERLPEIGVSVLAAEYGDVREMAWNGRYWVVPASGQVGDDGVTHWMPLPEPPEVA